MPIKHFLDPIQVLHANRSQKMVRAFSAKLKTKKGENKCYILIKAVKKNPATHQNQEQSNSIR
jgi:hypothetical protein